MRLCARRRQPLVLRVGVLSGQHIPKPAQATGGEVVDPYVQLHVVGHELDSKKFKTVPVRNNGTYHQLLPAALHVKMF